MSSSNTFARSYSARARPGYEAQLYQGNENRFGPMQWLAEAKHDLELHRLRIKESQIKQEIE